MFFVQRSQHFSQSDFGILFPHLTRWLAKAEEPERILELNTRAIVQMLRENGIEVAGERDEEILDVESEIRRWRGIVVHDVEQRDGKGEMALNEADRKLGENAAAVDEAPKDDIAFATTKVEVES